MKKNLLILGALLAAVGAQAETGIISSTPNGTLSPTVYGSSAKTYLIAQGGFGAFTNNDGYCSSIVIDGEDMYLHNVIREYPGIDSWVKGHFVSENEVEFEFPQPVAVDPNTGVTLYAAMMKAEAQGSTTVLVPDTDSPCLRLKSDEARKEFSQIMPEEDKDAIGNYGGMIGLIDEKGDFRSYGEQNVSYKVWDQTPESPASDIQTVTYTATYSDSWKDSYKRMVKVGIEGNDAWIGGLCEALPEAWLKGTVKEDGSIVLDSYQYLGVANEYLYFMCGVGSGASSSFVPSVELKLVDDGYAAEGQMVFNLGFNRVFLGIEVYGLKLTKSVDSEPIPVNPEFGEPEWDEGDGMGVADVLILPEDVNGQALDPENLYYRVFFNGELAALEYDESDNPITELKYGKDSDLILFMYDWHFIIFLEPLESIGVQSVYKVDGKEYCSDIVTYTFPASAVKDLSASSREETDVRYYGLDGRELTSPAGICLRKATHSDGSVSVTKILKK